MISEMIEKRARVWSQMQDLDSRAKSESRTLSSDETQQWEALNADFDSLTASIQRAEKMKSIKSTFAVEETQQEVIAQPEAEIDYRKTFNKYLRYQKLTEAERGVLLEKRGTNTNIGSTDTLGGFAVPTEFSNELNKAMKAYGGMLQASRIFTSTQGGTLNWPTVDDTTTAASIVTEGSTTTVQDLTFGRKQFTAYTYRSLMKLSYEFLNDQGINIEGEVANFFAERFGRGVNAHFTTGTGSSQPTGVLAASGGSALGKTAAAVAAITATEVLDLIHSVDPAYRSSPSAALMMNDSTLAAIKSLTVGTADNRPLFVPSMREGDPDRIWGFNFVINQDMPSLATGQKVIAFGDWSKYIIRQVGNFNLRRLDERYADDLVVGYVGWARFDGKLIDTNAVKHLITA